MANFNARRFLYQHRYPSTDRSSPASTSSSEARREISQKVNSFSQNLSRVVVPTTAPITSTGPTIVSISESDHEMNDRSRAASESDAAPDTTPRAGESTQVIDAAIVAMEGVGAKEEQHKPLTITQSIEPVDVVSNTAARKHQQQIQEIPEFNRLDDADLKTPPPGTYHFPFDTDQKGNRVPYKKLFTRDKILPPADQPMHVQMLEYAHRWMYWASAIENVARRNEVLDWVSKRMENAIKYACDTGYFPREDERIGADKPKKGRTVAAGRQRAPFTVEASNSRPKNAILNSELETAEIAMEEIQSRADAGDLAAGEYLLEVMLKRLGRPNIITSDWTTAKIFNPNHHKRNLLMFSLYEVQVCRSSINRLEEWAARSVGNKKTNFEDRILSLRERAGQHLALAIELDARNPVDDDDVTAGSGDEIDFEGVQGASPLVSGAEENKAERDTVGRNGSGEALEDTSIEPANMKASPAGDDKEATPTDVDARSEQSHVQSEVSTERIDSFETGNPAAPPNDLHNLDRSEGNDEINSNKSMATTASPEVNSNAKRQNTEDTPDGLKFKKPKLVHDREPPQEIPYSDLHYQHTPHSTGPNHAYVNPMHLSLRGTPSLMSSPTNTSISIPRIVHPRIESQMSPSPVPPSHMTHESDAAKQRYIEQFWEPRINTMLLSTGQGPRTIARYSDIRQALIDLNFTVDRRNAWLRKYKEEKEALQIVSPNKSSVISRDSQEYRSPSQPTQAISKILTLPLRQPDQDTHLGELSSSFVQHGTGFAFRCLPSASIEQRKRLEDLISDYADQVGNNHRPRKNKNGRYFIIHDPEDELRPAIGHGFWDKKKGVRADDSEWFYFGNPVPVTFHADNVVHVNGPDDENDHDDEGEEASEPPPNPGTVRLRFPVTKFKSPATTRSAPRRQQSKIGRIDGWGRSRGRQAARGPVSDGDDNSHYGGYQSRGTKRRAKLSHNNNDSDSDGEYIPGAYD